MMAFRRRLAIRLSASSLNLFKELTTAGKERMTLRALAICHRSARRCAGGAVEVGLIERLLATINCEQDAC
jgi:hypothetical protein